MCDDFSETTNQVERSRAKSVVNLYVGASTQLCVEERALLDARSCHLFEAQGLGADLHAVDISFLGFASLELDGLQLPVAFQVKKGAVVCAVTNLAEFEHVESPRNSQNPATDLHTCELFETLSVRPVALVDSLMYDFPLCGSFVLFPLPLDMDQCTLSLAESQVL